jgi:hypothetical protein
MLWTQWANLWPLESDPYQMLPLRLVPSEVENSQKFIAVLMERRMMNG